MQLNIKSSLDLDPIKSLLEKLYSLTNNNVKALQPKIKSIVKNECNGILNYVKLTSIQTENYMTAYPKIGMLL